MAGGETLETKGPNPLVGGGGCDSEAFVDQLYGLNHVLNFLFLCVAVPCIRAVLSK